MGIPDCQMYFNKRTLCLESIFKINTLKSMFVLKCFRNFLIKKKQEQIFLLSGKMSGLTEHACGFNASFILNDKDFFDITLSYLVIKDPVKRQKI